MLKKVPLPLSGLMLGTAALGNLLRSYGEGLRSLCGAFAAFLFVLVLLKALMYPKLVKEELKSPVMLGTAATFPMGLMILSTTFKYLLGKGALYTWLFAIALHVVLIAYYSAKYVKGFALKNVSTVWYLVYCGIACVGITAPTFGMQKAGLVAFWFSFAAFFPLAYFVNKRYAKVVTVEQEKPLVAICAAPMSLCAAAYVQSVTPKNLTFLLVLLAVATVLYVFAFAKVFDLLTKPFSPHCAAYTYPFVFSAIAAKQTMVYATGVEHPLPFLKPVVLFETVVAILLVVYIYVKFMRVLFKKERDM